MTTIDTRDRRAALEQQKARLADRERKLPNDRRKASMCHLIECGGLVAKAGLVRPAANVRNHGCGRLT